VLGRSIIGAIYLGGKLTLEDTRQTALALSCYAIGLAGYSALKVINPAFYALHDARTPMIVSLISIGVNYGVASTMLNAIGLGHAGLALSTSAVAIFGSVALFVILRGRIGGIHGRDLFGSIWKISLASIAMGLVVWVSSHFLLQHFGQKALAHLLNLAVSIPLGLAVFYGCARALRIAELDLATRSIATPLLRRIRPRPAEPAA
jgi:putative peptidoglycan lipid II flippase